MPKPPPMSATRHEAFLLCGPTATGKTAVAHLLAAELQAAILSADAMLVYRGLDIGTAKPSAAERARFRYGGLDLVDPDQEFDVAAWLDHARAFLAQARAAGQPVIVVGGTGLYLKCLLTGLTAQPSADPVWRAAAEKMNLATLQAYLQQIDAARFAALTESDRQNPRRLIRAVELARGVPNPAGPALEAQPQSEAVVRAGAAPASTPALPHTLIPGLSLPPPLLWERIQARVSTMFNQGLLEEARRLRANYPRLSAHALQAIGYAEAFAVLDGASSASAAQERIAVRTRQLAKRQMTWFKHQAHVAWIAADAPVAAVAAQVRQIWRAHGPSALAY